MADSPEEVIAGVFEPNWPSDLRRSGRHDVWPIEAEEACLDAPGNGHYCTLPKAHRGDHLTLLARWATTTPYRPEGGKE